MFRFFSLRLCAQQPWLCGQSLVPVWHSARECRCCLSIKKMPEQNNNMAHKTDAVSAISERYRQELCAN